MSEDKEVYFVKVLDVKYVTHDVRSFKVEKPEGYDFNPGQATEVAINKTGLESMKRPFTFTSRVEDEFLEFTIKMYEDHEDGMTKHLKDIEEGDELIIHDVWGAIEYRGPGVFIAGGAGITPFISILRAVSSEGNRDGNKLFFSNKTQGDIILEEELKEILGENCLFTLTKEEKEGYESVRIDEEFLKKNIDNFNQKFYVCGPIRMVGEIQSILQKLGASSESIVLES